MTYHGRVKNGVVVLDEPFRLPEGAEVRVQPLQPEQGASLLDRMKDIVGIAKDLPSDLADNHDHYIHGAPKRK